MRRREFISLLGSAAAAPSLLWPLAARAQQASPVIGLLHEGLPPPLSLTAAFQQGLIEGGISTGTSVRIENRWAEGQYDLLPRFAAELVDKRVGIIVAVYLVAARAAKAATHTTPVVFITGSDPVEAGLVPSLNRPQSNLTGVAFMFTRLGEKNLATLHELVPNAAVIGALVNPNNPNAEPQARDLQAAARMLGLEIVILSAGSDQDIDSVFGRLRERRIEALLVTADGLFFGLPDKLSILAARHSMPTFYPLSDYVAAGGLISYGANLAESWRQAGVYVGKIVTGTKVADLPVIQATKFELAINLKTAKALGLEVPATLLARADEVIE
jgi:putative tryptophan/tyrosine transport system substrate-binding protein